MMLKSKAQNVLFISYDGLLDQLGGSQILPYVRHINKNVDSLHVISFEKQKKYINDAQNLNTLLSKEKIFWHPLYFSERYGFFGKLYDLIKMQLASLYFCHRKNIKIVHCRGHISAISGLFLKYILKVKYIFDFRGFWVDERVDKGGWNLSSQGHRHQFNFFKYLEKITLAKANHIVVLTHKASKELQKKFDVIEAKISVIPCCADYHHFSVATYEEKLHSRSKLNIPSDVKLLGYLGSVGSMYMIAEMLSFFKICLQQDNNVHLIVISQDLKTFKSILYAELQKNLQNNIHFYSANRDEVPKLLHAIDLMISFIRPTYSKIAASPTKIGESFASGIPVISNEGIGDVSENIRSINGGIVIPNAEYNNLEDASQIFFDSDYSSGKILRENASQFFNLDLALKKYSIIYDDFK
jgi:glycosyltransferase involved in cell wall biosynthesis